MKASFYILLFAALLNQACERKPKACMDVPAQLEAEKDLGLNSCSEHYDFVAWDFGDGSSGFIGENPTHHFNGEGDFEITLTAYSDGAYKSDEVKQMVHVSYRFLSAFQVIGESNFGSFQFEINNTVWKRGGAKGSFTEEDPYETIIWPEDTFRILPERMNVELYGISGPSGTALLKENINFELADENPVVIETENYTLKIFWTFK